METFRAKYNSTVPSVSGAAECGSTVPITVADGRMYQEKGTDVINSNNSNSLKELSMSEILKIAEARTRIAGVVRRPTDNPWRKRMAISANITRHQTGLNTPSNSREVGLTTVKNELDEEFFGNLLQRITREQFIPCSGADRLRKRMCLWDKENLIITNTKKRRKEGRANTKLTPPRMEFFKKRLSPRQNIQNSLKGAITQSEIQQEQEIAISQNKFTLKSIQDTNMNEFNFCFTKSDPSSAAIESVTESFSGNQAVEDCISISTQDMFKLKHDYLVDNINHDSDDKASSSSCYHVKKYPDHFWDSPRLSTIVEDEEPVVFKSSVLDALNMEFDAPLLTPPLSEEFTDCEACHSAKGEHSDNGNDNYSRFPSLVMADSDREIFEIPIRNLFT